MRLAEYAFSLQPIWENIASHLDRTSLVAFRATSTSLRNSLRTHIFEHPSSLTEFLIHDPGFHDMHLRMCIRCGCWMLYRKKTKESIHLTKFLKHLSLYGRYDCMIKNESKRIVFRRSFLNHLRCIISTADNLHRQRLSVDFRPEPLF